MEKTENIAMSVFAIEIDYGKQSFRVIRNYRPTDQHYSGGRTQQRKKSTPPKELERYRAQNNQHLYLRSKHDWKPESAGGILASYHVPRRISDNFTNVLREMESGPDAIHHPNQGILGSWNTHSSHVTNSVKEDDANKWIGIEYRYDERSNELNIFTAFICKYSNTPKHFSKDVFLELCLTSGPKREKVKKHTKNIRKLFKKKTTQLSVCTQSHARTKEMEISVKLYSKTGILITKKCLLYSWNVSLFDVDTLYKRSVWMPIKCML